ncbi:hypothetical protein C7D71_30750, partial [Klebsiella pneumoniae]
PTATAEEERGVAGLWAAISGTAFQLIDDLLDYSKTARLFEGCLAVCGTAGRLRLRKKSAALQDYGPLSRAPLSS